MLEKIVKVTNDFQEMYDAEMAKMKVEMTRIEKTYNPMSAEYHDSKAAARIAFNEKIDAERAVALEKVHMYADGDRKALTEITSKPAPAEALSTIELLKAGNPEKTSEFEVQSILEKYKDNYLATKIIVQITNAEKRFGLVCVAADSLVRDIAEVERMACDLIRQYSGNMTYTQAVLLKGEIIRSVNEQVQDFLQYNYVERISEVMRKAIGGK